MAMVPVAFYHQESQTARRLSGAMFQSKRICNRKLSQLFSFSRLQTSQPLICDLRRTPRGAIDLMRQLLRFGCVFVPLLQFPRRLTET
jgi:hypothetical protein